ncbi:hypothetical protein [Ornithinimicrobium murale]|uniref:hypothetical protein n=1 Tax=Ornithinimicrobium murale TaxID=1050153 RepID=UPI000E0D465F|nr:hypothetical protein [Ornithinimicrobium murale]
MLQSLPQSVIDTATGIQGLNLDHTFEVEGHPGVYAGWGFDQGFGDVFEPELWFDHLPDRSMATIISVVARNEEAGRMSFGVADSLEQILERLAWLTTDEQAYALTANPVTRKDSPGFRWHKHGPYIGDFTDRAERLGDCNPAIESVVTFAVHQYRDQC